MLLLALFYWVIDVRKWRSWAFPLAVIGMNPITIYVGQRIIDFEGIASFFAKGALQFVPSVAPILWALSVLLVKWLFLYVLYRNRIFMRV
jgi:predicted acyltransferase